MVVTVSSIVGYPFVASIASITDLDNRFLSIMMRLIILIASLLILMRCSKKDLLRPSKVLFIFLAFWILYLTRLTHDTLLVNLELGRSALEYWAFAVGTCFIPALAILLARNLPEPHALLQLTLMLSMIVVIVGMAFGDTAVIGTKGNVFDSGRIQLETLNPIIFGHIGATLFLIAYWKFRSQRPSILKLLVNLAIALLGVVAIGFSGSRGPLIALIAAVLFFELSKGGRGIFVKVFLLSVTLLALSIDLIALETKLGINIFSRLQGAILLTDASAVGRTEQVLSGWRIFLENPMLGGALEDPNFKIYPHNVIVESFMATGIIGGILFLIFMFLVVWRGFLITRNDSAFGVFPLLFVQYFCAAQFSGSLYSWGGMWVLATLIFSLPISGLYRTYASRNIPRQVHGQSYLVLNK